MAWVPYDNHKLRQYNGNGVNFASGGDTIKLMLVTSSYTPDRAAHVFKSDLSNEVSGTGYSAGGATIANMSATVTSNVLHVDGDNVTFSQSVSGFTNARYAILYKSTGVDATSPLVAYADLGGNVGNVTGDLVLAISDFFTV